MLFRLKRQIPRALKAAAKFLRALFSKEKTTASEEVKQERRRRCLACPYYAKDDEQCFECLCYVPLKTMMATESCPIGKWTAQTRWRTGL